MIVTQLTWCHICLDNDRMLSPATSTCSKTGKPLCADHSEWSEWNEHTGMVCGGLGVEFTEVLRAEVKRRMAIVQAHCKEVVQQMGVNPNLCLLVYEEGNPFPQWIRTNAPIEDVKIDYSGRAGQ